MKMFNFTKRQSEKQNLPEKQNLRPVNPAVILPMESRQLMSVAAPTFAPSPNQAAPHAEVFFFGHDFGDDARPDPAFGEIGAPNIPGFDANVNAFNIPVGLIGANLVNLPAGFSLAANPTVAPGAIGTLHPDNAIPSTAFTTDTDTGTDTGTTPSSTDTTPTPGSGLKFLASQAPTTAPVAATTAAAVTSALSGLSEMSNSAALLASASFHAQASAIAQKLEGVISMLCGLNVQSQFETIPQQLPALATGSVTSVNAPGNVTFTGEETHPFADGVAGLEAVAKNVGEAFLQSLVTDLAQFETALQSDSIMNELGHSLGGWRAAAVAGAVLAAGTYFQRREDEDEKQIDTSWFGLPLADRLK